MKLRKDRVWVDPSWKLLSLACECLVYLYLVYLYLAYLYLYSAAIQVEAVYLRINVSYYFLTLI